MEENTKEMIVIDSVDRYNVEFMDKGLEKNITIAD